MNYTDLLLLLILAFCIWEGYKQGFILCGLGFVAWAGTLFLAFQSNPYLSRVIHQFIPSLGIWAAPLAFLIAAGVFKIIFDIVINLLLNQIGAVAQRSILNKIAGTIPGFINGLIWMALVGGLLLLIPFNNVLSKATKNSRIAEALKPKIGWLETKLSPILSEPLSHLMPKTNAEVDSNTSVELPFRVLNPKHRPDLEAEMLTLVNKERTQRGLKQLKPDPEIAAVARAHSIDMFARSYFSHYTPEGVDPFGRMQKANITFFAAGENLALSQTLAIAHKGLMESPGHRANILNPAFGRLGIGIVDGGIYGLMVTQNFRN